MNDEDEDRFEALLSKACYGVCVAMWLLTAAHVAAHMLR